MQELSPSVPDVLESQIPESFRGEENAKFIALLKHYYNWSVQAGQPSEFIHNLLSYRDIDLTNEEFRRHLTSSLLDVVPAYSKADRTLLTKHIATFLKSKGSFDSFQFIMNAIYGEDIEIEWNSNKLFRPSANEYKRTASLVIESTNIWQNVTGSEIVQTHPTPARATIESNVTTTFDGTHLNWLKLDDKSVIGTFSPEGTVQVLHNDVNRSWYFEEEYYQPISLNNGNLEFYATFEEARPYENLIVKQLGSDYRAVVSAFGHRYQETGRARVQLSVKNETGTFVNGNDIYIFAPALESTLYTRDEFEYGIVSKAVVGVNIQNAGSLYDIGDEVIFLGGSGELVEGYVSDVSTGGIDTVNIIKKGYGYSVGDVLKTNDGNTCGSGAQVVVSNIDGIDADISLVSELNTVQIVNGGNGYHVGDEIEIADGTTLDGTPPIRLSVASVASTWLFKGVKVTTSGRNYPRYTKIALVNTSTVALVAGFVASATIDRSGAIRAVIVSGIPTIATGNLAVIANGYGASYNATVSGGAVTGFTLVNAGVNYINPEVVIHGNGSGAVAVPVMTNGTISSITLVKGGAGYTSATVTIRERLGSGFTAIPLIQNQTAATGTITGLTILQRGEYTSVPNAFSNTAITKTGSGFDVVLNMDYRVKDLSVDNAGKYYHAMTTSVQGKGSGAILHGKIRDGVLTSGSFNRVSGGSGYTYAHVFVNGGTSFVGTASISGGVVQPVIAVSNGGFGYATTDIVTIVGDGVGASFTINSVLDGVLQNVEVISGGSGYYYGTTISAPVSAGGAIAANLVPTIVNGVIKSVSTDGGIGYVEADLANITIDSGTQATLSTTVSGTGGVIGYDITNKGSGYKSQSEVSPITIVSSIGTGALFNPTLDSVGAVARVDVLEGGSGYTMSSTLEVFGGGATVFENQSATSTNGWVGSNSSVVTNENPGSLALGATTSRKCTIQTGQTNGAHVKYVTLLPNTEYEFLVDVYVPTNIGANKAVVQAWRDSAGWTTLASTVITERGQWVRKALRFTTTTVTTCVVGAGIVGTGVAGEFTYTGSASVAVAIPVRATLKPIVYNGRITDVVVVKEGAGYQYGTYARIIGDGIGAFIKPIVETGITSAEVLAGGEGYTSATVINITDPTGSGAEIRPTIVNGAIKSLKVVKLGSGYTNPTITATIGVNAVLTAETKRFIKSLLITNKGSDYSYADVIVIGDGYEAEFELKFEKLGSIDTASVTNVGAGITTTPTVLISDNSGYGSVSKVKITNNGGGYKSTPILTLDDKYSGLGALIATGAKFSCFGKNIGGVRSISFLNHGAHYNEAPTPIFPLIATLAENASFKVGETVTIKSGSYRDVASSNNTLLETGDRLLLEDGSYLTLDVDDKFYDTGVTAVVEEFDYDRNTIELLSGSDVFFLVTEDGKIISTEDESDIVDQKSGSFDVGDTIVGLKSGGRATIASSNRANGTVKIGGNGWSEYSYQNDVGMLNSSRSVIADNLRYQDYAYVVKAGRALKDYEQLLKETVHPAGFSLFGDVVISEFADLDLIQIPKDVQDLIITLFIYTVASQYQSGSEWSDLNMLAGDFTKFNQGMADLSQYDGEKFLYESRYPISAFKNYQIQQVSDVVYKNYLEYAGSNVVTKDLGLWTQRNGIQVIHNAGVAPDGSMTMHRLVDSNALDGGILNITYGNALNKMLSFEFFVKKQTNPTTYPQFVIYDVATGGAWSLMKFNPATGTFIKSATMEVEVKAIGDYWFIRMIRTVLTQYASFYIMPAQGYLSSWLDNLAATGSIEISEPTIKDITGKTPYNGILRAVNPNYVADKKYMTQIESEITIA